MPFNLSMLRQSAATEEVSQSDLNALLGGRKFGKSPETYCQSDMNPAIPEYSDEEMAELQEFCRQRGIIGVNFNGMNPKAVLKMLRAKMGIVEQTSKRGILNG
jgi:hypothetical protein